jgi:hypothetical protein
MQSGSTIQSLVGLAVMSQADDCVVAALKALTPQAAGEMLAALRALPRPRDITDCVDQYERLGIIGEISKMAYFGPNVIDLSDDPTVPLPAPASLGFQAPIHFDELLRHHNSLTDRRVAAGRLPTFSQRRAAFDSVEAYCRAMQAKATGSSTTAASQRLIFMTTVHENSVSVIQDKMLEKSRLTQLVLRLMVYRGEHGNYPKTLAELGDAEVAAQDLFADDAPVHYVTESATIYSVGPNQRDDKGVYNRPVDNRSVSQMFSGAPAPVPDHPDDIAVKLP